MNYRRGDIISHPEFGQGRVLSTSRAGLWVAFEAEQDRWSRLPITLNSLQRCVEEGSVSLVERGGIDWLFG